MNHRRILTRLLLVATLACLGLVASAQGLTVSGTVTDESGLPVIGAGVVQQGTSNGTATDVDGKFSLSVPRGATLAVSSIGYVTKTVVADRAVIDIVLSEDTQMIEETIVVGYGVQRKSEVTGAISSVKAADMENRTISNVEDALQGKTAGVQLISASASPGASPTVRVRGYSSNTTSDPLFVVDGVRMKDISGIDPNDIESMEVLKDAASAAIYGAEAGNGVVLITTKKGKSGDGKVTYSFQYTLQSVGKVPEVMNAEQYAQYMVEGGLMTQDYVNQNWDGVTDTDWAAAAYETGVIQRHNLAVSNGSDKGNYYVSLSWLDNDGIIVGDKDYFKRLSGSVNAEQRIKAWLTVGTTNQIDKFSRRAVTSNSFGGNMMSAIMQSDPLTPVSYTYDELPQFMLDAEAAGYDLLGDGKGNYWSSSAINQTDNVNPFIQRDNNYSLSSGYRISGSAYANVTPIKGLVFTSRLGYSFANASSSTADLPYYGNATQGRQYVAYSASSSSTRYWQWENFANYAKTFGQHTLTAMAGMSYLENNYSYISGSLAANGEDAVIKDDPTFYYLNYKSASATQTVEGEDTVTAQYSFFGRLGYTYADKYMLQASLRADAADLSYLPKDNRWGYFPAVSAGWAVSKEPFFDSLRRTVNDLKLRASWGQNGSLSALGDYAYSTSITSGGFYPLVGGNVWTTATYPTSMGNDDIKWETSGQIDLGMDVRMFQNRLTFSVDWYDKKTKDLLIWDTNPSFSIGGTMSPVNAGNVVNRGIEFELGWQDAIGELSYGVKGNVSTLHNEVTYLDQSLSRVLGLDLNNGAYPLTYFEEGYPVYYFRGYKFAGVDAATGDPTFEDLDGDGLISENDKTMIGSGVPSATFGLTLNAAWKGFDFTLFAQGTTGNDIFCALTKVNFPRSNRLTEIWYDDRWTATNTGGSVPRANSNDTEKYFLSDAMVYDASYLKIKQIQLGYTLPAKIVGKVGIRKARAYVSLEDYFTFTDYVGSDPEMSANSTTGLGVDLGGYPASKKVVFGINVEF